MKKKYKSLIIKSLMLAFFLIINIELRAQSSAEPCATDIIHKHLMATDAIYATKMEANEVLLQQTIADLNSGVRAGTSYRIPVVVHVIHLGETLGSGTNISDAQIYSAIRSLNDAYRKKPGTPFDGNGVDTGIEFCLAQKDAAGAASSGILRVNASTTSDYATNGLTKASGTGSQNEVAIKALSKWDNTKYYNMWVVTEIDGNNAGSGNQGFAYFPGAGTATDGAVMLYNSFGFDPGGLLGYNLKSYTRTNGTLIHEMGHGLGLYHTFQGDGTGTTCPTDAVCGTSGDCVSDTPLHMRSATGTCNSDATANSCQAGTFVGDFQHNYMDYSSEACKVMFTAGQSTRMNAALASGPRAALATTANLTACGCSIPVPLFSASPLNPCVGFPVHFIDESLNFPTAWTWTFSGGTPSGSTIQDPTSVYSAAAAYDVTLLATSAAGISTTLTKTAYINPVGSASLPFVENFEGATFPPQGWKRVSTDAPSVAFGTNGIHQWELRPAGGNTGSTVGSAAMNLRNYNTGLVTRVDELIVKPVSLAGVASPSMTFKLAYQYYNNPASYDSLKVFVSTDCGSTYGAAVYSKSGKILANNVSSGGVAFIPSVAGDWRTETVDLSSYIGQSILIKFTSYGNLGNNIYVDDLNITGITTASVSISETVGTNPACAGSSVSFTANPTNGGTAPAYQWKIGSTNVGTNSANYTTSSLTNGQIVTCVMTSNLAGVTGSPATSNAIAMAVTASVTPSVTIAANPAGVICAGASVSFTATPTNGGAAPAYQWKVNGVNAGTNSATFTSTALTNGQAVTCVLTSNAACASSSTAVSGSITMAVNLIPPSATITANGLILTSSTATGNLWYLNGSIISAATAQSYTATQNGSYTVIITTNGCSSPVSSAYNVVNVGVAELNEDTDLLTIYPNPGNGQFNVSFNVTAKSDYKIELVNAVGQLVFKEVLTDYSGKYSKSINISEYGKGVYTISLINMNDENQQVRKIIVY